MSVLKFTARWCGAAIMVMMLANDLQAQNAAMTGTVSSAAKGVPISAASVFIVDAKLGASTDLDGRYEIRNIPPGTYAVRVGAEGYTTAVFEGVVLAAGQTLQRDFKLEAVHDSTYTIEDILVSAQHVVAPDQALLTARQEATTIGDAISAEQIAKSPDATSGDALKRVTGLSMVDNKYVFVRGVTDRYNVTTLNGVAVTSTDTNVDKKSFSFDLIPSSLLSNTVVVKTATPDLPGDFTGGLVQVNTLDFPPHRVIKLSYSSGFNTETSTRDILASTGGGKDWLAKDDGTRALPPGDLKGNSLAKALQNTWTTRTRKAPLNGTYNLAVGDVFSTHGQQIGFIGAFVYRDAYEKLAFENKPSYLGVPLFSFDGIRYERSVMLGGLGSVNYKPTPDHTLSFRSNYIRTAEEKVSTSEGHPASGEFANRQTIQWDERTLRVMQVQGEHTLQFLRDLKADWRWFDSKSEAQEPDRKFVSYEPNAEGDFLLKENYRSWSALDEKSHGWGADFGLPIREAKIKAGFQTERKDRSYDISLWVTDPSSLRAPNYGLIILPLNVIFLPENYGPKKFSFIPATTFTGKYNGGHDLTCWYGMTEIPFGITGRDFKIVAGARVEDSNQYVNTTASVDDPTPITARIDKKDVLPSANFTWVVNEESNLRLAFSRSLDRPEFREMANVLYYDFNADQNVIGNPNLRRALVSNYDVRYELFPGADEVVAASFFYKSLTDAIEERLLSSPERYVRTWFNSSKGKNYGSELELRKSLGFIPGPFDGFSIISNYTRVWSSIEYTEGRVDSKGNPYAFEGTRQMQGQSPWNLNLSLVWAPKQRRTTVTMLYNRIGRRLNAVGDTRDDDVYEESRNALDVAVTRKLPWGIEMKFTASNILDKDEVLTSGPEKSVFSRTKRGKAFGLSASLNL